MASSSLVDTTRYKIDALRSDNYFMWSRKMQLILRSKGVWTIVSGEEKEPEAGAPSQTVLDFQKRKDTALTSILLTIEDSCVGSVIGLSDPTAVWLKLQELYQTISRASIDALLEQYQAIKMKANESVMGYVNRLSVLETKLVGIGHQLEETDKLRALIRGLRDEYQTTGDLIRAMNKSLTEAVALLVVKEGTMGNTVSNQEDDFEIKALRAGTGDECHYCGKKGHYKRNCWKNPKSKNFRRGTGRHEYNNKRRTSNKPHERDEERVFISFVAKCLASQPLKQDRKKWYIDSGCSMHMCNDQHLFEQIRDQGSRPQVSVGNGDVTEVHGKGKVNTTVVFKGKKHNIELTEVLYVPGLMCNLLSVSRLRKAGFRVTFDEDEHSNGYCIIMERFTNRPVAIALEKKEGLYELVLKPRPAHTVLLTKTNMQKVWHRRLGHVSADTIRKTLPIVRGIPLENVEVNESCESCLKGKSTRLPRTSLKEEDKQSTNPLDLVHSDVKGPFETPSLGLAKYFITLYDDSSALSLVRFLKNRSEADTYLQDMIKELETVRGGRVKRFRFDNAGEYVSRRMTDWLSSKGISREPCSPYSPESNGKAERLNRTLCDMARTMMSGLKRIKDRDKLWAEAINVANFLRNRMFSSACANHKMTPYESIMGKKPDLSFLRIFGSTAYVHVPKQRRKKQFQDRAKVGILVGFERGNSYKIFFPNEGTFTVSRDVKFDEEDEVSMQRINIDDIPGREISIAEPSQNNDAREDMSTSRKTLEDPPSSVVPTDSSEPPPSAAQDQSDSQQGTTEDITHYPQLRQSTRLRTRPDYFSPDCAFALTIPGAQRNAEVPSSFQDALRTSDAHLWSCAMKDEMEDMERKNVLELVAPPPGCKPIKTKWVYAKKMDSSGNVTRYRARLVAKGFSQRYGLDYGEVFSAVVQYTSLRLLLSLVANREWKMISMDIKAAFLHGQLDEELYMEQPEGFAVMGKEKCVYRLRKAIYGLKQASRAWRKYLERLLLECGCRKCSSDAGLFTIVQDGKIMATLVVYVDDIIIAGPDKNFIVDLSTKISSQVEARVNDSVTKFLGIIIEQSDHGLKIHNSPLIESILQKFNMMGCKPAKTPLPEGLSLGEAQQQVHKLERNTPYRELVGVLMHLSNTVRPDITYSVNYLARFMNNFDATHWTAAKHILRYLKGSMNSGIVYKVGNAQSNLRGFADADFAGDQLQRKSTTGLVFMNGDGIVSWRSKRQSVVAQSTQEAEYISLSWGTREAIWLNRMLSEVTGISQGAMQIQCDNQAAIGLTRNDIVNDRTKHIEVKYHFIRNAVERGLVQVQYCETTKMLADIMTKNLGYRRHKMLCMSLGMDEVREL